MRHQPVPYERQRMKRSEVVAVDVPHRGRHLVQACARQRGRLGRSAGMAEQQLHARHLERPARVRHLHQQRCRRLHKRRCGAARGPRLRLGQRGRQRHQPQQRDQHVAKDGHVALRELCQENVWNEHRRGAAGKVGVVLQQPRQVPLHVVQRAVHHRLGVQPHDVCHGRRQHQPHDPSGVPSAAHQLADVPEQRRHVSRHGTRQLLAGRLRGGAWQAATGRSGRRRL
mmetsp:Transcript_41533/g.124143  ORF Transcript_41533/g.124143 Transcript_41533/m.124143 type:complete len:227 (-) Transcript_41533:1062-1742(-)